MLPAPDAYGGRRSCVPIYLQCGACGFTFNVGDRIIALHGKNQCDIIQTRDVGDFPSTRYCDRGDSLSLQRGWIAYPRDTGSEYATVHDDCLRLYNKTCRSDDKYHRLWVAACWRRPWFEADPLNLQPNIDIITTMNRAADICDLPHLHSLPNEISEMIWNQIPTISMWRYTSVLDLAGALSETKQAEQVSVRLGEVSSWQRGSAPVIREHSAEPVVRLTIDSQGLQRIETLSEMPTMRKLRSENMVYIIRPLRELAGVLVLFKFGLARLGGSMKSIPNYTWDTPTPPVLRQCLPYTRSIPLYSRFATIDTRRCTGITFFISPYKINAIHGHTREAPSALSTWEHLMYQEQRDSVWVYLPLSKEDHITAFGLRMKMFASRGMTNMPCFLVRMSKSGDVALGPYHEDSTQDFVMSTEAQPTLVHDISELDPICSFGVFPHTKEETKISPRRPSERFFHYNSCFSSAVLRGVSTITVFYEKKTGGSRGLLLEYENGGRRALGQCRLGVMEVRTTEKPKRLCLNEHVHPDTPEVPRTVDVWCTANPQHEHQGPGWQCYEMDGVLECWSFGDSTALKVVTDASSEHG